MGSVSVLFKIMTEVLKDLSEEERQSVMEKIYGLLYKSGNVDGRRRQELELKFQAMVNEVKYIKDVKHFSIEQAFSLLSEKYPEFIKQDNLSFDFKMN